MLKHGLSLLLMLILLCNLLACLICRYDVEYLKYYTNLDVKLATAFSGFYTKNNPYKPVKDVILTIGFKTFRGNDAFPMRDLKTLYKRYTLPDLMSHRVIQADFDWLITNCYICCVHSFPSEGYGVQALLSHVLQADRILQPGHSSVHAVAKVFQRAPELHGS